MVCLRDTRQVGLFSIFGIKGYNTDTRTVSSTFVIMDYNTDIWWVPYSTFGHSIGIFCVVFPTLSHYGLYIQTFGGCRILHFAIV